MSISNNQTYLVGKSRENIYVMFNSFVLE